jgi:hypothetical protein
MHGTRISLAVGIGSVALAAAAGIPLGLAAGYWRRLDDPLMRLMDLVLAFPAIILALAIVAAAGPSLGNVLVAVAFVKRAGLRPARPGPDAHAASTPTTCPLRERRLSMSRVMALVPQPTSRTVRPGRSRAASRWCARRDRAFRNTLCPFRHMGSVLCGGFRVLHEGMPPPCFVLLPLSANIGRRFSMPN